MSRKTDFLDRVNTDYLSYSRRPNPRDLGIPTDAPEFRLAFQYAKIGLFKVSQETVEKGKLIQLYPLEPAFF